jgi:hypothetical protein
MPPKARAGAAVKKVRRKERKNVAHGQAHIKSTFNTAGVAYAGSWDHWVGTAVLTKSHKPLLKSKRTGKSRQSG